MRKTTWQVFIFILLLGFTSTGWASVGKVIIAKGETYAIDTQANYRLLKRRSEIREGDTVVTGTNSELHIRFNDNAVLALRADSQLTINDYSGGKPTAQDKVFMELLTGGFRTITGSFGKSNKDAYQIKTPNASIGVRGTNYEAVLSAGNLLVGVYHGGIRLQNNTGEMFLGLDNSFSFAVVRSMNDIAKGLLEAPPELNKPLSTSFKSNASAEDRKSEKSTELTEEDDALTVDNLFDANEATDSTELLDNTEKISTLGVSESISPIQETIQTLANSADLRLTAEQVATLTNGTDVGFVVVNENPIGYRIARYELGPFSGFTGVDAVNAVSFDITLNDQTFTITLDASYTDPTLLVAEINSQIRAQMGSLGSMNPIQIPPTISMETLTVETDTFLVLKGFVDGSDYGIIIDNFTGTLAENVAIGLSLCDNSTVTCTSRFDLGEHTTGHYETAVHFSYVVDSQDGPVFVNYNSESITALNSGYVVPDNVFKGNADATLSYFNPVNTMTTGENLIEWGYWASTPTQSASLYKDPHNLSDVEQIETPFFFVTAAPLPKAELIGETTLSTVVDWHATSANVSGMLNNGDGTANLTATLAVNFSTAAATGTLALQDANDAWGWDLQYFGKIKDAQFFSEYGWGTYNDTTSVLDAVGHVEGLFTPAQDASNNSTVGFVGGFGLQTTDDTQSAQGIFVLK